MLSAVAGETTANRLDWQGKSPGSHAGSAGRRTDLGGFLSILTRYKWSILAATLAGLALGFIALSLIQPVYVATGAVFVDPRSRKIVTDDVVQGGLGADAALVESQVAIIGSESVLKRVVAAERLAEDPEFAPEPQTGWLADLKAVIRGPRATAAPEILAVENLARSVSVDRAQKSYVIAVSVATGSAEKSARLANAIIAAYTADQMDAKTSEARRANSLIDGRLGELREQVRRAETRVDEFKKANKILTSEGGFVSEQQLGKLNAELATARAVAAEANARYEQVQNAGRNSAAENLPEAVKSGLLQRLREQLAQVSRREAALAGQLRDRHPVLIEVRSQLEELRGQINSELKRVAAAAKGEQSIARARERELARAIDTAKEEVARTATAQIKLRELEQEVALSRELLGAFLARAKETQEQVNLSTPEARIISEATLPTKPAHPIPMLILTLGLLGGLGAGLARALIADAFRERAVNPGEAGATLHAPEPSGSAPERQAAGLALPAFGTAFGSGRVGALVGRLSRNDGHTFADVLSAVTADPASNTPPGRYRAAIGRLLQSVRSRMRDGVAPIVAVGAARTGTGASSTALALAYRAALDGETVLLVDATSSDTHLSEIFAKSFTAESIAVLDDKDSLMRITTRDARSGLTFLPIALADLRTFKITQRRRFATGLKALAADFDLVVVDAGNIAADEAAAALADTAADILIVTRPGAPRTEAGAVDALVSMFPAGRARTVSVGLNTGAI